MFSGGEVAYTGIGIFTRRIEDKTFVSGVLDVASNVTIEAVGVAVEVVGTVVEGAGTAVVATGEAVVTVIGGIFDGLG